MFNGKEADVIDAMNASQGSNNYNDYCSLKGNQMAGFKAQSNTARPAKGSFIVQSKNES